jgi:hypothetical protein
MQYNTIFCMVVGKLVVRQGICESRFFLKPGAWVEQCDFTELELTTTSIPLLPSVVSTLRSNSAVIVASSQE